MTAQGKRLIHFAEYARRVHLWWARHQEAQRRQGRGPVPNVGGATHHRWCVAVYDELLTVLRAQFGDATKGGE